MHVTVPNSLKSTILSLCGDIPYTTLGNPYGLSFVPARRPPVMDFEEATIAAQTARHLADLEVSQLMLSRNASDSCRCCHGRLSTDHSKSMSM